MMTRTLGRGAGGAVGLAGPVATGTVSGSSRELPARPPARASAAAAAPAPEASPPSSRLPFRKARRLTLLSWLLLMGFLFARILAVTLLVAALALRPATPATAAGPTAPLCTPATLNNSQLLDGAVTVSPMPGSRDVTSQSQISFLGVPAADISVLSVVGSRSGAHRGRLLGYSQGDGASFLPQRPFAEGERVYVHAQVRVGASEQPLLDDFQIAVNDPITTTPEATHPGGASEVQGFASQMDLHPPRVIVTAGSPEVAQGDEFLAPYGGPGQAGPMIVEQGGGLIWFKPLPAGTSATNLQVQQYDGRPVLTWWQGDISVHGFGLGEDLIASQRYTDIARVRAGNGLKADLHEFDLTPQGTALITAYEPIRCDLAPDGGAADGALTDSLFQEIDVRTGLVMYQWTSADHVALSESHEHAADSSMGSPFDFFHLNSISVDRDGSLLISSRNTWTVYDLSQSSGQINWQLGGKDSTYQLEANVETAWQHDPRELEDGSFSIFDNGASPTVHAQSRAIVVSLNPQAKTAGLVTQLTHPSPLIAESQGNVQALANGDWFVGWGQLPDFSEFNAQGELLFDARFTGRTQSYRSFKFPWSATPAQPPAIAVQLTGADGGVAYASWNGATGVSAWRVLSGASSRVLRVIAEAPRSGFETPITLPRRSVGAVLAAQALNGEGRVMGTAPAIRTAGH